MQYCIIWTLYCVHILIFLQLNLYKISNIFYLSAEGQVYSWAENPVRGQVELLIQRVEEDRVLAVHIEGPVGAKVTS